ncbi:MAG: fatty acid desaturase [Patescibacteria group bacterium]
MIQYLLHGYLNPTPIFLILFFIATSLLTLLGVSCFLHRSQTHRSVTLAAPINHIFRFILWVFTGMITKEWVAIHRKHHAFTDIEGDPHSPRLLGLKKVFFEGADIYTKVGRDNKPLLDEYGKGTPDDWLENNLYNKRYLGIGLTFVIETFLFGLPAIIIWPLQMLVIPVIAAGFINGVAHVWGTQRYKEGEMSPEGKIFQRIGDSRNVPTFGLAVGEEFHNNHHAYQDRFKFSHKWFEFDLAGTFIEILCLFKLAEIPKR